MSASDGTRQRRGLSLGVRIFVLPLVVLALLIGIAYFSLHRLQQVKDEIDHVAAYWLPAVESVSEINEQILVQRVHYERVIKLYEMRPLPSERIRREVQAWQIREVRIDSLLASVGRLAGEDSRLDSALLGLRQTYREFSGTAAEVLRLLGEGDRVAAGELENTLDRDGTRFELAIETAQQVFDHSFQQAVANTEEHERGVLHLNLVITVVGAVFSIVFAGLLTVRLTTPVRRLMNTMRAVEQGDLDVRLQPATNDEIGLLTASFNEMVGELKLKDTIEDTFGKYVDARIVQRLLEEPGGPSTGGENQVMTVLFGDIAGFAEATRMMSPEALVELDNQCLTQISEPVVKHGGIIDKYIDTMVMAFWGRPFTEEEEHAHLACAAALEQADQLPLLHRSIAAAGGAESVNLDLRIGLATGSLVVGNMGSDQAKSYTVMGDTVNIASRLKGANKVYGTRILINEETHGLVAASMETREIDLIKVVGKDEPLRIYELIGEKGQTEPTSVGLRDAFHEGLAAYRQRDWDEALGHFERCALIRADDGPTAVYVQRVDALRRDPPADDWDGVWHLTQK